MENIVQEQKTFTSYHNEIVVCGKCCGKGKIYVYSPKDIFKMLEPKVEVCPLCKGSGILNKKVTIITDLEPFVQPEM